MQSQPLRRAAGSTGTSRTPEGPNRERYGGHHQHHHQERHEASQTGRATFFCRPSPPESYVVHASAATFTRFTLEGLKLEVGGSRSIDVTLTPENQAQSVTVTATAPELVTDHLDRGNVIESQFVQNTPLNIRNPL